MTAIPMRNALVILLILAAVNACQAFVTLHVLREDQARRDHIEVELRQAAAVLNQMCINTRTPCVYTLQTAETLPPR